MKKLFLLLLVSASFTPYTGVGFGLTFLGVFALALLTPKTKNGYAYDTAIPIQDAQGLFTKSLITVYDEKVSVMGFLRSFFKQSFSMTKEVSIAVRRNSELMAVDVNRYSDGNHNTFSKSTEKVFIPPFFDEWLNATDHDLYDRVILAISQGDDTFFSQMTADLAEKLFRLRNKIERRTELACAQVLQTGIVEIFADVNIDFGRKAGSLVDPGAGNYFTDNINPYDMIEDGCIFIRTEGKSQSGNFNYLMGAGVQKALFSNATFLKRNDLKNMKLDDVRPPEMSNGAVYHGNISCGAYSVDLWTYPEYYDTANTKGIPYVDDNLSILLPSVTNFDLAYAAVPQLIQNGSVPQNGPYLIQEFYDYKRASHEIHIKCAALPVPTAIDTIYTLQAIA